MLDTLDIMIGLITVYLVVALVVTAIVEVVSALMSLRSKRLRQVLEELLGGVAEGDHRFLDAFYDHPLVQSLSSGKNGRPSHVPNEILGRVVEDLVTAHAGVGEFAAAVDKLPNGRLKGILKAYRRDTRERSAELREAIEGHYDAIMERASGWYKRKTQTISMIAAALLVVGGNVDSIAIIKGLADDPVTRARMVEQAGKMQLIAEQRLAAQPASDDAVERLAQSARELDQAVRFATGNLGQRGLPIGWSGVSPPPHAEGFLAFLVWLLSKVVGFVISAFAISLGAPFWFDVLQRFMRVRSSGEATVRSVSRRHGQLQEARAAGATARSATANQTPKTAKLAKGAD